MTVQDLIDYNDLSSTNLSVGQRLLIPNSSDVSNENYDTYIVKSGDSLYKIANQYNTTVSDVMNINNLSTNLLSIGQKILVPKQNNTLNEETTYTVKSGDNLYAIANRYGISVDELKNYNNLTSNNLSIGQLLRIPTIGNITYTVKSGDNLYDIANQYNTTIDEIKRKNNLTSNLLRIGQILII